MQNVTEGGTLSVSPEIKTDGGLGLGIEKKSENVALEAEKTNIVSIFETQAEEVAENEFSIYLRENQEGYTNTPF